MTHTPQAEGPRARVLYPTHTPELAPRRPGHSPRPNPSGDATTSFVNTEKQRSL